MAELARPAARSRRVGHEFLKRYGAPLPMDFGDMMKDFIKCLSYEAPIKIIVTLIDTRVSDAPISPSLRQAAESMIPRPFRMAGWLTGEIRRLFIAFNALLYSPLRLQCITRVDVHLMNTVEHR